LLIVLGFLTVLLAAFFFCFQNVIVRVLFNEHTIFGVIQTGGFVTPTLQHSFLLMLMRTLLVVPLMTALASTLYPPTWKEIRQLRQPGQRTLLWQALGGGSLMFLYLALLYVSVGLIPTGIALTLFFTYPVFTALLSWRWFGDRPSLLRWGIMALVLVGSALTLPPVDFTKASNSLIGISAGITSGIAYALYTVVAQKSFEQLHPIPYTWISFVTTLVLSAASFLVWHGQDAIPWQPLWIGSLLSAIVTFAGHTLNNLGIRLIGATAASIAASSNPTLTVVLAWLAIQERLSSVQIAGVAIVTLSVALLSQEKRLSVGR
jgi:drug/metabolite transporter (DMT)-like permease